MQGDRNVAPQGWISVDVGTVTLEIVSGSGFPKEHQGDSSGDYPFAKVGDISRVFRANQKYINSAGHFISEETRIEIKARIFPKGSIVFPKIGEALRNNYRVVTGREMLFDNNVMGIIPDTEIVSVDFLYHFLTIQDFGKFAVATAIPSVRRGDVASIALQLPPLREQHRIVAKIEELFSELDQGVASLKAAREQLKVYRQSLLKNAFEGKLTATWRAAHRDQLETAAALQQRIAHERQARYQQQLTDWQNAGQPGPKPKPPKPLPPLTAEELAELPELPVGWGWIRVGELVDRVTVGYVGPMKDEYIEQGVPFLRSQNVRENRFDSEGLKFVSEGFHQSLSKSALAAGDVVVVRSGSVGVSCVIPEHLGEANCSDLVIVKAPRHVSSHLLAYYMNWQTQGRVKQKMVGVALIHFNTKSVEGFAYPLCSEQEQRQIEKLLAEKLSEADQLDQTLATALQQADALRQSILKKAFSGQLVEQDKNDEPATALLERIRAARATSPAKGRQAKLVSKSLTNC